MSAGEQLEDRRPDNLADHLARASSPLERHAFRRGPRITALETLIPAQWMPGLVLLRIHTDGTADDGRPLVGHGESYYIPEAVAAILHDWMAPRLLGSDACAIESHWRFLYERGTAFGVRGCELRALSAVDLALWDILGQVCGQPVWRLLGGPVRDGVPVYNSCGGPLYGRGLSQLSDATKVQGPPGGSWPGHGDPGRPGPLEDNWRSVHEPQELARELLEEGYTAMKVWALDALYQECGSRRVSWAGLEQALRPLHAIREAVGMQMELMLDGHGFFALPAALRIAGQLREIQPLWIEDVIRPDNVETIVQFRKEAGVPVAVSEMLVSREEFRQVLQQGGADYVMIDPTWVGGISETRRIAELALTFNIPALMHDCTGPLTFYAGLQVAAAVPNVTFQESVRAHLRTLYPHLLETLPTVEQGHARLPESPGLGTRLRPELFAEAAHAPAASRLHRITRL